MSATFAARSVTWSKIKTTKRKKAIICKIQTLGCDVLQFPRDKNVLPGFSAYIQLGNFV